MPQMFPLDWMIMMPMSVLGLKVFLIMIYYLNNKLFFKLKIKGFDKGKVFWEW